MEVITNLWEIDLNPDNINYLWRGLMTDVTQQLQVS